ncbi:hypothetical protein HR11_08140 [Porphyromonas macacae]|nr:hypothetical protein HR11_08140 [Porphyromonas macacae]
MNYVEDRLCNKTRTLKNPKRVSACKGKQIFVYRKTFGKKKSKTKNIQKNTSAPDLTITRIDVKTNNSRPNCDCKGRDYFHSCKRVKQTFQKQKQKQTN